MTKLSKAIAKFVNISRLKYMKIRKIYKLLYGSSDHSRFS